MTCKAEGCLQNMNEGLGRAQPAAGAAIRDTFKAPDSERGTQGGMQRDGIQERRLSDPDQRRNADLCCDPRRLKSPSHIDAV